MAALTIDEIKSYASEWKPKDKDVEAVTKVFNQAGIHDGILEAMRIERGEVALPESLDDIHAERRRKEILAEVAGPIERLGHFSGAIRNAARSSTITDLSTWEFIELIASSILMALFYNWIAGHAIKFVFHWSLSTSWLWWPALAGFIVLSWHLLKSETLNGRTKLAAQLADRLSTAASAHRDRLQHIKSELEDGHNIDLIRARDIANVHRASAVATAIDVGNVTKSVAAETAEITKNLIQEGQKLKAEHAASQVELIDQLAGNLERPAPQASPAAPPPVDDRDARIAALKAELAKEEEIRTLEARLTALKGGR